MRNRFITLVLTFFGPIIEKLSKNTHANQANAKR